MLGVLVTRETTGRRHFVLSLDGGGASCDVEWWWGGAFESVCSVPKIAHYASFRCLRKEPDVAGDRRGGGRMTGRGDTWDVHRKVVCVPPVPRCFG